jgi:hypothetical protein
VCEGAVDTLAGRGLAAEFDAAEQDMIDAAGAGFPDQIGLREQVLALHAIGIGFDAEAAVGIDGGAGKDVA